MTATLLWTLASVGGCASSLEQMYSSKLPIDTPVDWWHQLEGGTIADERPPPPGLGLPYPSLGSTPAKPVPTDAATRSGLSARLASQRNQMERANAQDPITPYRPQGTPAATPAPATPTPATPTSATPAPAPALAAGAAIPDSPPPMARIEAATAPAPAPTPAAPAPPPAPAAIQQAAGPKAARPNSAGAPGTEPLVSGPAPALPTAAPPLPNLPGVPAESLAPAPRPAPQAAIAFLPNSAVLRPESDAALRAIAARRADGPVAILGGGDALSPAPEAQAAALPLAWRRARAIQAVLASAGVPAAAMRVDAAALGRGGVVRLIN